MISDLNTMIERQEDVVRKARERAGDLAHGLKTPLTILQGEARRLETSGNIEFASLVRQQVEMMRRHVDRELARARTVGATAAGGTLTDAHKTVSRLIDLVGRMPRADAIAWENQVDEGLRVRIDPDDFGEVMGNLLDNARKWASAHVTVGAEVQDGGVCFVVDDDGPASPSWFSTPFPVGANH